MQLSAAVAKLKERAPATQAMGASALYLFGSTARGEAEAGSDIDLFIDHDRARKFSLFDLVGIKLFLEAELGTEVDVTTRDGLHPLLRPEIEQQAVRIF